MAIRDDRPSLARMPCDVINNAFFHKNARSTSWHTLMDFLIKHKLINPSQHGFLKAKSCLTNLLCFLEEITKWVDDVSPVDVIYLDFQKAFDKVPHQRLISKLKSHGMGNSIIN